MGLNLDLSKLQVNKDEMPELKPLGPISDLPSEHINGMNSNALSNLDCCSLTVVVYRCFIKPRFPRFALGYSKENGPSGEEGGEPDPEGAEELELREFESSRNKLPCKPLVVLVTHCMH